MRFLTTNLKNINDIYSLAIVGNVFQKAGNFHINEVASKLKSKARNENDLMWWTNNDDGRITANSVGITAYALMALLETPGRYTPAFDWLVQQRNSHDGFGRTQDTVVGLEALIKCAQKFSQTGTNDTDLKVHYVAKDEAAQNVKENILRIDTENELVLQEQELPPSTRSVEINVLGRAKLYFQFVYQYYIPTDNEQGRPHSISSDEAKSHSDHPVSRNLTSITKYVPLTPLSKKSSHFVIKPMAKLSVQSKSMTLIVCYTYQPQKGEETRTNMVTLQIQFPSGFVSNGENIQKLQDEEQISRVEVQSSSTTLAIYFEKLEANDEQCLTIMADRLQEVQSMKSSRIEMYDFYNSDLRSEILYDIST